MARYLQTAAKANVVAKKFLETLPKEMHPQAAAFIAQMVNFGIRCAPRAVQSTVRLRAVQGAVSGLPVKISMSQGFDPVTKRKFNALSVVAENINIVEGDEGDDGSDE